MSCSLTETIDVFETCRFCRCEDETVENEVKNFTGIIKKIASIKINLDPCLPCFICNKCVERLLDAVTMQELCIESEMSLLEKYFGRSLSDCEADSIDVKNLKQDLSDTEELQFEEDQIKNEYEDPNYQFRIKKEIIFVAEEEVEENQEDAECNEPFQNEYIEQSDNETEEKENDINNEVQIDENILEVDDGAEPHSPVVPKKPVRRRGYAPRSPVREGESKTERMKRKARERASKMRRNLPDTVKQERKIKECCQCSFTHIVWPVVKQHYIQDHLNSRLPTLPDSPIFCLLCWTPFNSREEQMAHAKQPLIKKLQCEICQRVLPDSISLRKHLSTEHGIVNKPFQCDECESAYATTHALKEHKNLEHMGLRHVCDECGQAFKRAPNLKEHKNLHLNITPYKCPFCDMRFPRKTAVRSHLKSHTGERPYKCEYCDKRFAFATDKKRHLPLHTGIYPYTCDFCKKGFIRKNALNQHLLTHDQ